MAQTDLDFSADLAARVGAAAAAREYLARRGLDGKRNSGCYRNRCSPVRVRSTFRHGKT